MGIPRLSDSASENTIKRYNDIVPKLKKNDYILCDVIYNNNIFDAGEYILAKEGSEYHIYYNSEINDTWDSIEKKLGIILDKKNNGNTPNDYSILDIKVPETVVNKLFNKYRTLVSGNNVQTELSTQPTTSVVPAPSNQSQTRSLGTATRPQQQYTEYVVKSGDTLSSIAKEYNATHKTNIKWQDIQECSNKGNTKLKIGEILRIPTNSQPQVAQTEKHVNPPQPTKPSMPVPVVINNNTTSAPVTTNPQQPKPQFGEVTKRVQTAASNSQPLVIPAPVKYNMTEVPVASKPQQSKPKFTEATRSTQTVVTAPSATNAPTTAVAPNTSQPARTITQTPVASNSQQLKTENKTHTVKSGESPWRIARNYGISVEALYKANSDKIVKKDGNTYIIQPNVELIIPAASTQQQNTSSVQVAKTSSTSIPSNKSQPVIQSTKTPVVTIPQQNTSPIQANNRKGFKEYIIKKGDTLSKLEDKLNCTQENIVLWNKHLNPNNYEIFSSERYEECRYALNKISSNLKVGTKIVYKEAERTNVFDTSVEKEIYIEVLNKYLKGVLKGKAEDYYEAAKNNNINLATMVAISLFETASGTSKLVKNKHNVAGMRIPGSMEFRTFNTIKDSINDFAKFLNKNYYSKGLCTLAQIKPRYCPNSESSENEPWLNTNKERERKIMEDIENTKNKKLQLSMK